MHGFLFGYFGQKLYTFSMKRFFGRREGDNIIFEGGEAIHIRQVLRMREGEAVIASLNDENDYYCTLVHIGKNQIEARVDRIEKNAAMPERNIVLFQAMPKREYFETIVTKAVEFGASRVVPFKSAYSVNHDFKRERMEQIILTASKQCERSRLMELEGALSFDKMLESLQGFDVIIFANERENEKFCEKDFKNKQNIAVIVGCEGGFNEEEKAAIIAAGAKSISLGKRILRCDSAALAMMTLASVLSEN